MPLDNSQRQELKQMLELKKKYLLETAEGTKKKSTRKKKNPIQIAISNEIKEINQALKRLEEQEERFGYCEHCFIEIPWRELVANPARHRCSRCS